MGVESVPIQYFAFEGGEEGFTESVVEAVADRAHRVTRELTVSVVGQNLLDDHHPESADLLMDTAPTQIQRGVYSNFIFSF